MAHIHSVYDTDKHFVIDPVTRTITNVSGKVVVVQGDHNSERFTFEIPRTVEGHDMSTCNRVEVHYNNVDTANPSEPHPNAYEVVDLGLSPDDENVVILSWLISSDCTRYVGKLNFSIKFMCDDGDGKPDYVWKTITHTSVSVATSDDSGEVIDAECEDMLKAIEERVTENVTSDVDDKVNEAVDEAVGIERKRIDELVAMRTDGGAGVYTFEDDMHDATVKITTNGAVAKLTMDVSDIMLDNGERYVFVNVPSAFAPMENVRGFEHFYGDNIVVAIDVEQDGTVTITFLNRGEETTINGEFTVEYPLATLFVREVVAARVGYDNNNEKTTYDNLGNAVCAAQQMALSAADLANNIENDMADVDERVQALENGGGGLPETTTEDNDKVLTVVDGEPQWALHAGISKKQRVVFADDGEGNVSIVLVEGDDDDELGARVDGIETTLYGGTTPDPKPDPEPVETVTVTNLVTDPQIAEWPGVWTIERDVCTEELADGNLYLHDFTGKTSNIGQTIANQGAIIAGHRYYTAAFIKCEGSTPKEVSAYIGGTNLTRVDEVLAPPVVGEWYYASSTFSIGEAPRSKYFYLWVGYASTPTAETNALVDHFICIDLTAAFGEGNEPDRATMDKWMQEQYPNGFEGTTTLALVYEDDDDDYEDDGGESVGGLVGQVAALENKVAGLETGSTTQTGTVYPTLDAHYIANIEEARPEYYNALEHSALTFTMLADIHQTPTSVTTIKNVEASSVWAKLVNNDFVMLGGDLINDFWDKADALSRIDKVLEMAEKHAKCPVYVVKGNHDTNEQHKINDVLVKESRLTDKEFYQHANARAEKYGMVVDPNYPYNGYYYVDFPNHKIRMVCLNSTENIEGVDITTSATSAFRYGKVESLNQMAWIKDTALRVDDGWAVMMFSHMPPFKTDNTGNRSTENPDLRALCEAFAAGTGDFAEQGAREFIGHFCGHVHVDSYNNIGGLNYVTVNCTVSSKKEDTDLYLDRTAAEDKLSLNSFIIDRATHTVKCIKIGAAPADDYADWVDSFTWNEVSV